MALRRGEQATVETPGTNEKRYLAGSIPTGYWLVRALKHEDIRKSGSGPKDKMVLKSLAMDAISQEYPDMARAVIAEERSAVVRRQMGVA